MQRVLAERLWTSLGGQAERLSHLAFRSEGSLPSAFFVTELAAASIASAGLALGEWLEPEPGAAASLVVDRRLASLWFSTSLRAQGWAPPDLWDAIAGNYRARDGWIRLHTNAPHHRAAALRVLGADNDRERVAAAVANWNAGELELAIVKEGGCAAEMRSWDAWKQHPQGIAVAREALVLRDLQLVSAPSLDIEIDRERPLAGLRVLDLTRVLAGPIATRFLAGFGAEVLRIDPPDWDEPGVVPEVTLGKHCARLDLRQPAARERFQALLASADVLVHGYRADALERLGLGADVRRSIAPGLVDVSLNAYGWSGPWSQRRGFDSLVQMSSGIAEAGRIWRGEDKPVPLPVQALDHATGYLIAAAALRGLAERRRSGRGSRWRLSLARTAQCLLEAGVSSVGSPELAAETAADLSSGIETTPWGHAQRLRPPLQVAGSPLYWELPASELGSAPAAWQPVSRD
ncbi:CoA transferase [Pseudomonas nicosulfuronedens]|uniref:Acyl-CoA transferase n=1 Tax=Pseudomonas nicosulfuronedens TaxID=2571105 RepID=A0A5R9QWT0_9PSED|nr:CoA transferase [Pseudomonas nicosulfuronedens]MDH1012711.1 CoA transferase [Pseudomonas nicosulfuronedens]MDH1981388.1 CoA transferase [Pseudomonas nicosulfuronedens]MDH2029508.1 CoA transferase [Pseudomonas nicosulfuronedens]TLX74534.1 acyl-CoA transferase [Pseudomonas nicosulfuronedens]